MKFSELKEGQHVVDSLRPHSTGKVLRVRTTVAKIMFDGNVVTYDKAHVQFLTRADGNGNTRK